MEEPHLAKGVDSGHFMSFEGPRTSTLVSRCFEKPLRRMPFSTKTDAVGSKMPCSGAMTPPRLKK